MVDHNEKVAEYYDITLPYYKWFWHRDSESSALHYGFWENDTRTVKDALLNENKFLAELAGVRSGTKVLDAGCGIGGSAIWLAKNRGAHVVGITLSKKQLEKAKELAKARGIDNKAEFYLKDFMNTGFPDDSFDVVWAIESVCHAVDKKIFLKEAYRVLKKGGRIVVADGFLRRKPNPSEEIAYNNFLEGFVLPGLASADLFREEMAEVGFRDMRFLDKTEETKPSSKILYKRTRLFYPVVSFLNWLHIISNVLIKNSIAGIAQWELVKGGIICYGVFYGEK